MNFNETKHRAFIACLFVTTALPVHAQGLEGGFYGRVFGGASILSDTDLAGSVSGNSNFDTGQIIGGAVGYRYPNNQWRAELEYAYRSADADGANGIEGDFASTAISVNGYYSFAAASGGKLSPYIGAGLVHVTELDFDLSQGSVTDEYSDTGLWGYQLMIGADYALNNRWALNGELRFFDAGSQTLSNASGGSLSADYSSVDLIVGTSFRF